MAAELHCLLFWPTEIYIFTSFFSLGFISTYSEIPIITKKNNFGQSLAFLELKKKKVTLWLESNLNKMLQREKLESLE